MRGPLPGHPLDDLQPCELVRVVTKVKAQAHQRLGELPVGALEGPEEGPVAGEQISAKCRLAVDQQLAHPGGLRQHLIRALGETRLSHEQRHPPAQRHRQQGEEDRGIRKARVRRRRNSTDS